MNHTIAARLAGVVRHPAMLVAGVIAIVIGVTLQLVDLWNARNHGFRMMDMGNLRMIYGSVIAAVGVIAAALHLLTPPRTAAVNRPPPQEVILVGANGGRLRRSHLVLLLVLVTALIIDTLKPATIGFVLPGMRAEYGLSPGQVALLPLITLGGAVIGSLLWGYLVDKVGRRRPILLATLLFAATAVCGAMPSYHWNIAMCFLMGLSAGGMLPAVITLLAESLPTRMRGAAVVLVTAFGGASGYLLASGLATWLLPIGSWRLLWAMGLPTALILIAVSRLIPESPRFLLRQGRYAEAEAEAGRYHLTITRQRAPARPAPARSSSARLPIALGLLGIGIGMVNWGLVTFLPTLLQARLTPAAVSTLLLSSALLSVPVAILAAWAYARASSKWSIVVCGACLVATLAVLALLGGGVSRTALVWTIAVLLAATGALAAMFNTYAAETSKTSVRGWGAGMAAGSFKLGGLAGPGLFAVGLTTLAGASAAVALPLAAGALLVAAFGTETRGRGLETIDQHASPSAPRTVPMEA